MRRRGSGAQRVARVFFSRWRGQFSARDLVAFLDRLPRRLWLEELGVDGTLAASLRRDLSLHVAIALLILGATRASFSRSAVFRAGRAWVRAAQATPKLKTPKIMSARQRGGAPSHIRVT